MSIRLYKSIITELVNNHNFFYLGHVNIITMLYIHGTNVYMCINFIHTKM